MNRYESDTQAISRAISALGEGQTIDHGTARAIASGYSEPGTIAFVSMGALIRDDVEDFMSCVTRGVDAQTLESDAAALNALEAYIADRYDSSDTGRVDGWSDMWAVKHIDYPHESGRLYDCPACEAQCHCVAEEEPCVHCAEQYGDDDYLSDAGTGHGDYEYHSGH
jgi:hypothetical protein